MKTQGKIARSGKPLLFLFLLLITTIQLHAQRPYHEMMLDSVVDYDATVAAFEQSWQGRSPGKGQGYNVFRRWQYMQEKRRLPDGKLPGQGYEAAEMQRYAAERALERRTNTTPTGNWTPMGPIVFPTNNTGQPGGIGRLTTVAFHPTNPSILFAGAPAGGLWSSNDGGTTWSTQTDFLPTLGVSAILIHPGNPNIMYIGTGDKDAGDASGLGVYKSIDGGATWTVSNTGMGNRTVRGMVMDPNNPALIVAATSNGLYRSVNSGANWTQVLATTSTREIRYRTGSTDTVYVVNDTRFYQSNDDGATWNAGTVISSSARSAFALSSTNPNTIYVVKDIGANPVFKSTDGGATFSNVQTDGKLLMTSSCSGGGSGGQGWYDICMAVDPTDDNVVFVGGVSLWKTVDGGATFSIAACWSNMSTNVHADHHFLAYSPHFPARLYDCNDGGLYYSDNAGTSYTNISSGLATSQIYRVAVSGNRTDVVVAGFQDNGMIISRQPNWFITAGGDGLDCAIDPTDNNYQFGSYVSGVIRRSTNGGYNWGTISGPIPETGPWLTPYVLQPGNPNVFLTGYVSLWRSTDVKSASPTFTNVQTFASSTIRDIHFADANTAYFSRANGEFWQSVDAGITWVQKTNPPGGDAEDIAADPANPNTVWVAAGNEIYRSLDGGTTWAAWDTGLPNIAALTVVYDRVSDALYCGMWTGVYYRAVGDASWSPYNTGLPNSQALHLQIYYDAGGCVGRDMLRLATYGRGLWESDLRAGSTLAPVACFGATPQTACAVNEVVTLRDSTGYDPTSWAWTITGPGAVTYVGATNSNSQNPQVTFGAAGTYSVTLQATNANGNDTETRLNYINVIFPIVAFTTPDSLIYAGQTATFTDASSSCADTWLWDFGDGNTSTLQNPTHTYAVAGLYTVSLTVNGGLSTLSKTNHVQVLPHLSLPFTSVSAGWTGDMENAGTAWHFGDKRISGTVNTFERGSVSLTFPAAASGTSCWATDLDANVPTSSYSTAVYSPTFDFSAPGKYQVRLKTCMQSVFCNAPLAAWIQYTTDLGLTWTRLGGKQGTDLAAQANWYNKGGTGGCDNADQAGSPYIAWNYSGLTFRQAIYDASALVGNPRVGFRIAFASSSAYGAFTSKGFAFDDFEVDFSANPLVTDTIPGRLVNFDGVDDYIETFYEGNLPTFTMEGWVRSPNAPSSAARSSILQKNNAIEFNWNHPSAASRGAVALRNTAASWQNYSFGPLAANTWYHLAVTFDGTTVRTYKNGELVTSAAFTGTLTTNTNSLQLGNGAAFFLGQVDEFRIWNSVRTLLQIREAMHRTLDPAECTNVVLYYQSNETAGYLRDATNLRNGYLMAGLGRALSPIAVGRGVSQSLTVGATGLQDFTVPQLQLDFTSAAGTPFDVTVTRINQFVNEQTPNPAWNAAPNTALVDRNAYFYHVINKFGGGAFSVNATVQGVPGISSTEASIPTYLKWVKRNSNSVSTWDLGIPAVAATVSSGFTGTVTFNNVTTFSQAFIGSEFLDVLPSPGVNLFAVPDIEAMAIQVQCEFDAEAQGNAWILSRARNAAEFETGFGEDIAFVPPSTPILNFSDVDVLNGQTWYYRLRSRDANGQVAMSEIVSAQLDAGVAPITVSPNPNEGRFWVSLMADGQPFSFQLTDLEGRLVYQQAVSAARGPFQIGLDLAGLAKGMYILRVDGISAKPVRVVIH